MTARQPVTPDDLRAAAALECEALLKVTDAEWDAMPPKMTWTRKATIVHTVGALHFYATQLASGSSKATGFAPTFRPDAERIDKKDLPGLLMSSAAILARIADGSPVGARGLHPAGCPDAEGFLAMGCVEVLMHAWDTVSGTSASLTAPDDMSERVVRRLFPWSPAGAPGWQALLFETGRAEIDGCESPGDMWMWHNDPLDEWDGTVKRSERWRGR